MNPVQNHLISKKNVFLIMLGICFSLPLSSQQNDNKTPAYPGKNYNYPHLNQNAEFLLHEVKVGSIESRSRAIITCGQLRQLLCFRTLVETLFDDSEQIRKASATALGTMKLAQAVNYLEKAIVGEKVENTKTTMIWAVGMIGVKEKHPFLAPFLKDESHAIRRAAAKALRLLDAKEATPYLEEALKAEPNYKVNLPAVSAEMRTPAMEKAIIEGIHDSVTFEIYYALASLNSTNVGYVSGLLKMIQSGDMWVRVNTGNAIRDLNLREGYVPLQKALLIEEELPVRESLYQAYLHLINRQ